MTGLFLICFPKESNAASTKYLSKFHTLFVYSICQRRTRRNAFHYPLQLFLAFEKISVSAFRSLRSTYGYRLLYSTQGELSSIWLYFEHNSRMSDKKSSHVQNIDGKKVLRIKLDYIHT